jgi:hypothetical protein
MAAIPKRRGPRPERRRRVNPALRATVRSSGRRIWQIAALAGLLHPSKASSLIQARSIPATQLNIQRLERIADSVGFDRDRIFLTTVRRVRP